MEEKSREQEMSAREISLIRELAQIRKEYKRELEYEKFDGYELPPRTQFSMLNKPAVSIKYLVAKDRNAHGCFALKTTHGKHLVELKRELNREVGYKGVQLVTISRPTAYGEYAPYHFVDTEQEFQTLVKSLRP